MPPLLETDQVRRIFRPESPREVRALDGVSLQVEAGTFVALVGASGSGKTSLLTVLGALARPTSGRVSFDGQDLTVCSDVELTRIRRRVGFLFQDFALLSTLPVWENVTCGLIPRGESRRRRKERAEELLEPLGLADRLSDRPQQLSGGEQQRVALARALAGQPEAILADEPTSNLDRQSATTLIELLRGQHAQGQTLIVATHDQHLIAAAQRVVELADGRIVADSNKA